LQRIGDDQAQVWYFMVARSGGQVTICAVCTMHMETMSMSFLVDPQNH
jgi:hypothetical protein